MAQRRMKLDCELTEDMHTGSGLGRRGVVDALHAKDAAGRPVVWSTTLAGLLRNEADALHALGHRLATPERIRHLFGREGEGGRGHLVARSLHFDGPAPRFSAVAQTAREVGSRRPLDDTLRVTERSHAGLTASAELRCDGSGDDWRLLQLCLRRLHSVGGGKTRGQGRVRITQGPVEDLAPPGPAEIGPGTQVRGAGRLRLVVENLEPLCFPRTAVPGNLLLGEGHLPGPAVLGALLWALRGDGSPEAAAEVEALAGGGALEVTAGYPLPPELLADGAAPLAALQVSPVPASAERCSEGREGPSAERLPWWARGSPRPARWLEDPELEHDRLLEPPRETGPFELDDGSRQGFDRIREESYLASANGVDWYEAAPRFTTLMRNRTPVNRLARTADSRREVVRAADVESDTGDLFSETALREGQLFLVDVRLADAAAAGRFLRVAGGLLARDPDRRRWLRLGRGGRPAIVRRWEWLPEAPAAGGDGRLAEWDGRPAFSVTLTSDAILRGDDLLFRDELSAADLAREAGAPCAGCAVEPSRSAVSACEVRGFSTAAGTRRQTALALLRGSAVLVTADSEAELRPLFEGLRRLERSGRGIGERTQEGFGRLAVNSTVHRAPEPAPAGGPESTPAAPGGPADWREGVLKRVLAEAVPALAGILPAPGEEDRGAFPSRNQWQELRHRVEPAPSDAELEAVLEGLVAHSARHAGRSWGRELQVAGKRRPLVEWLQASALELGELHERKTYLEHVCRWVVQRLANERGARS